MKIAFYPNPCNNNYPIIKALRAFANIDAHLYISEYANIQNLPESEEPEILANYPTWIHKHRDWSEVGFLKFRSRKFINELNKYDVVFLSDQGVILAPYLKGKKIFLVSGGDLTRIGFPKKFFTAQHSFLTRLKMKMVGYLQQKGIKSVDEIWTQTFSPFTRALKELDILPSKIKGALFKVFVDTSLIHFKEDCEKRIDSEILAQISKFKFKIFHPSRLMMKKTQALIESGQWKQNDLLFYGLRKFLDDNPNASACIILIDRIFGGEIEDAKKIIREQKLENNVVWIKAESNEGFTKNELVDLYSVSDLVVDEFGIGWFGSIVCEGLACSKPVICNVDETVMSTMYEWHPIISVNTIEGIADEISKLYTNEEYVRQKSLQGLKWINQYHTFENGGKDIAFEIKKMLS